MESHFFIRLLGIESESEEKIKKLLLSDGTIDESELIVKAIEGTEDLQKLNEELAKEEDNKKSSHIQRKLKKQKGVKNGI